jgi:hypothetical protein
MKTDLKQTDPFEMEIFKPGALTLANYREKVTDAEEFILTLPQLEMNVDQQFIPGIYTREITIPAGAVLTGSVHKKTCVVVVSQGEIVVAMAEGMKHITAPFSFISPPGHKRIAYALSECKWMTIHPYFEEPRDEDEMKQVIGCDNYALYDIYLDQQDYLVFCQEIGLTEEQVQLLVQTDDLVDFGEHVDVMRGDSDIDGSGMFASNDFSDGERIGKASVGLNRTDLGRYTNHSINPNLTPEVFDGDCVFYANRKIEKGVELTVNYRETTRVRSQS